MKELLLLVLLLVFTNRGSSQNPLCSGTRGRALGGTIIIVVETAMPDPVCIRCGYIDGNDQVQLVTSIDDVVYNTGGSLIVNTTDISVTNDGLILDDPGNTYTDGTGIVCTFNQPGNGQVQHTIIIQHFINNPPTLNPDGGGDRILDVIEGSNITLTCTRDSGNNIGDLYQWIHPDGQVTPESPSDATDASPLQVTLSNINRAESGVYICEGTRTALAGVTVQTNVTLNVQYPARVLSFTPGNSTVTVNTTLTLNCTFEGNPAPNTASWSHNGTELFPDTDDNLSQTDTDTYSLLEVDFVNINISGQYACGVNNSIGIDQTDFTFIIVQVAPGPVATLDNDSVTETSVTLSWSFGFNGNAEITGVDITYIAVANFATPHSGSTSTSPNGQQTSITITGLQPLTTYEFSVTVRNTVSDEVGVSLTVTITVRTLPLVPDPPTLDSVTALSSTELRVTWTANLNSFTQTPIGGFVIKYTNLADSTMNSIMIEDGSATTQDITGLNKGTIYRVTVISANSAGPSPPSNAIDRRTNIDPPSAVTALSVTAYTFSICVAWEEPTDDGGQDITSYTIEQWNINKYQMENFTFVETVGSSVLTYTVEGLDTNVYYSIRVTASNDKGGLGERNSVNETSGVDIPVDNDFVVTVGESYITAFSANVSWTVAVNDKSTQFRLQLVEENEDFNPEVYTNFTANTRYAIVRGLQPNTSYDVRLTRIEGEGCIRRVSEIVGFETQPLVVEVKGPSTGTVIEGNEVTLMCNLNTGGGAPDVTWIRNDGALPDGVDQAGNTLIIRNPRVEDSGNYTCISRAGTPDEARFTFSLVVMLPPPMPSTSTSSPSPSPTIGSPEASSDPVLPLWTIIVIAVIAALCILFFIVMVIIAIYCYCFRKREKSSARYDLGKTKAAGGGMWMDQGASDFASIPQFSPQDPTKVNMKNNQAYGLTIYTLEDMCEETGGVEDTVTTIEINVTQTEEKEENNCVGKEETKNLKKEEMQEDSSKEESKK